MIVFAGYLIQLKRSKIHSNDSFKDFAGKKKPRLFTSVKDVSNGLRSGAILCSGNNVKKYKGCAQFIKKVRTKDALTMCTGMFSERTRGLGDVAARTCLGCSFDIRVKVEWGSFRRSDRLLGRLCSFALRRCPSLEFNY